MLIRPRMRLLGIWTSSCFSMFTWDAFPASLFITILKWVNKLTVQDSCLFTQARTLQPTKSWLVVSRKEMRLQECEIRTQASLLQIIFLQSKIFHLQYFTWGLWALIRSAAGMQQKEQDLSISISQRSFPEDDLLNISRNSFAKSIKCFLGNSLRKWL